MTSVELLAGHLLQFSENVHDSFGQSIMDDVLDPIAAELQALVCLDEWIQEAFAEIAARAAEADSL
jgi:hypothetical protein